MPWVRGSPVHTWCEARQQPDRPLLLHTRNQVRTNQVVSTPSPYACLSLETGGYLLYKSVFTCVAESILFWPAPDFPNPSGFDFRLNFCLSLFSIESLIKAVLQSPSRRSRNYLGSGAGAEIKFLINILCSQFRGCISTSISIVLLF